MSFKTIPATCVFLMACHSGLSPAATPEADALRDLKTSVTEIIDRYDIPALGIAMVDENGPVWVGAMGSANLEMDIDADEQSLFRIASTSKMFVALSVLKLAEEGRLSLQDELSVLAPEVMFGNQWEQAHPVRLVHLLEHTSGWDEQHYPEMAQNDATPSSLKQDIDFHPHSRQSRWPPGTRFSYTNSGPAVAAYVVEKISGQMFEDYVRENFFGPIKMTTASYFQPDPGKAQAVTLYADGNQPLTYRHMYMRPSGSVNASPLDMARLVEFYLGRGMVDGVQIISKASLERMESVKSTSAAKAGQQAGYGLNNYTSAHKQWVYREHNGGFEGAMTEFAYLPEAGLGHAFMITSKNQAAFKKISKLLRDYETRNLPEKKLPPAQTVTKAHREIEGYYYPINPRLQKLALLFHLSSIKSFRFEGDTLVKSGLLGGKKQYFHPVSENLYRSAETGMITLSRVTDALAGTVIHDSSRNSGSANNAVFKSVPAWLAWLQQFMEIAWPVVVITSMVYFPIWFTRKLRGKIPAGATIRVRLWPLLASLSMVLVVALLMYASSDFYRYLSRPTLIAVSIMLATIGFSLFSLMAVVTVTREYRSPMNRINYWYCAFSSASHLLMTLYFLEFGVIGVRFWT